MDEKLFEKIQFSLYAVGGSVSLFFVLIMLKNYLKVKKKGIIVNCLIMITISEMLNCFHKLINFLKNSNLNQQIVICEIQITIAVFSDLCTPLMSYIISREINSLLHNNQSSFGKNSSYKIYLLAILFPGIVSTLLLIIEIKENRVNTEKGKTKFAYYLQQPFVYLVISVVWIFLSISLFYCISSLNEINQKSKEYFEIEQELVSESKEQSLNFEGEDKTAFKLNQIRKALIYPFFICFVWFVSTITRVLIFFYKRKIIFIINAFLSTFRGFYYYLAYFSCNCLLCCLGNKNQNNQKIQSLTTSQSTSKDKENDLNKNCINNDDDGPYKLEDEDEKVSQLSLNV
jgi:hypothetical protein